jgi:Nitric oxide reductase activation protein
MSYIDRLNIYCQKHPPSIWSRPSWYFKGYSNYWRVTQANSEVAELAGVLRSLSRVVGRVGMNVGRVIWAGQFSSDIDEQSIVLPLEFILDEYPLPQGKMDVLIGVVVHESLRQCEWSENVWKEMITKRPELNERSNFMRKDALWKLFSAGENIYLDKKVEGSILSDYVGKARKVLIDGLSRDPSRNPTPLNLFDLWEQTFLDGVSFPNLNPLYAEPLDELQKRAVDLDSIAEDGRQSVIVRCRSRVDVYLNMWGEIEPHFQEWELDHVTYFEKGAAPQEIKKKKRRKKTQVKERHIINEETWEDINVELARGRKDLTPLIKKICNDDEKVMRTTITNFTAPASAATDRHLVMRLKNVFQYYAERVKKINRGLDSGKIDRRRLYRGLIDGKCFKIEQMIAEFSWNFTVVIDASMSMAGFKWRIVENTMSALHKALQGYQNRLSIFGYFEWDGVCIVSELLRKDVLYSIAPTGRTPSGQAILAAALLMPRETKKRKFILHITDGESNSGVDVRYALDYCKQENIDMVTLGCGYKDKDVLIEQYGKRLQFLDTIEELPKAVERLFQRILKY